VALAGVMCVLGSGVAWGAVPAETVGCSGVTARRRLRDWTAAGVRLRLHAARVTALRRADLLDLGDCSVDGSHVRALKGGIMSAPHPRPHPPGSKHQWKRGIKPVIARCGIAHVSGLGKVRWVVERAFAWLRQFERLRTRCERRAGLHRGLLELARSLICLRRLRTSF
jgi:transposase